jgi:hypothetical protein
MDISNPEEHVSKFVLKTRAAHDRCDGLGGEFPGVARNFRYS